MSKENSASRIGIKDNKIVDYTFDNLLEVQLNPYFNFVENELDKVFADFFPMVNEKKKLTLHYEGFYFLEPKCTIQEAKNWGKSYDRNIYIKVKLVNDITGDVDKTDIFVGHLPHITSKGTFLINGSEKIIVLQIVRSPGCYFKQIFDKKSGYTLYYSNIIPSYGAWIEYEVNSKGILWLKIDKVHKIPGTTLLKVMGMSNAQIENFFNHNPIIIKSLTKDTSVDHDDALLELYNKIYPGDPTTLAGAKQNISDLFFKGKKYTLSAAGRFKVNEKLNISGNLYHKILAEDVKDSKGKLIFKKGTFISRDKMFEIKDWSKKKLFRKSIKVNNNFGVDEISFDSILIYSDNEKQDSTIRIVGVPEEEKSLNLTFADILCTNNYLINFTEGAGNDDDIDDLSNRRIKNIGEILENQFRIGLARIEKNVKEKMSLTYPEGVTPKILLNPKPLSVLIHQFFNVSQLCQFLDQTNPLSELANKRRITALGPGGLSRDRASFEVRDVHFSYYGRICPIETPEGPNIGLISNLGTYVKINKYGFLTSPYRVVTKGVVSKEVQYLTASEEYGQIIAGATTSLDENNLITSDHVVARYQGSTILSSKSKIKYIDLSPKQIVSIATSCIPFLEHDDANRALMGANMQRQAVPLLIPDAPNVRTGMEERIAQDSGQAVISECAGKIQYVDGNEIIIVDKNDKTHTYPLLITGRSNQETRISQKPLVSVGQKIKKNEIIADGPAMKNGCLALGQNITVGFMTWRGYNYEDAIIISERLVKDDVFTSIHISEHTLNVSETKLGNEEITRNIPNTSEESRRFLDEEGVVTAGATVSSGDILVGKVSPKGQGELSPEDSLLISIFGEKSKNVKDNSLRVPQGGGGVVVKVIRYTHAENSELPKDVNQVIKVFIAQKRKIQEGDKMAGRHGNKGVISIVLPEEDLPHTKDGKTIDILLNPLGVPSRMNVGQLLELHLGAAALKGETYYVTPVFEGLTTQQIENALEEQGIKNYGSTTLYDGRSGEKIDNDITVGVMYMLKLSHMVDDKIHSRGVGPYSLITQQPLGGKAQNGGQRFGEMEVWALEAYGCAYTLREMLTIKSDDIKGRTEAYEAIIKGEEKIKVNLPESFLVLVRELKSLALNVTIAIQEKDELVHKEQIDIEKAGSDKINEIHEDFSEIEFLSHKMEKTNKDYKE